MTNWKPSIIKLQNVHTWTLTFGKYGVNYRWYLRIGPLQVCFGRMKQ